ncbi:MAG: sigma-70 family RNA polymerase sigma factor [Planctomycetales bacterium]
MPDAPDNLPQFAQFERYRSYLLVLARLQLDRRWHARIDPSDLVQQTLLDAHARWHQLGTENAELAAWLRKALANNLADALRTMRRAKRDVTREVSLEGALDDSSAQLGQWVAKEQSSPSQQAARTEDLLRLTDALTRLPELQREAIIRHHLQGWSLRDTARELVRSDTATAGLLHRGLKRLRELMRNDLD